ncbi:hypothetical protein [Haliangium sp. UPWRP_2]|uniref:hypothetical protein n=1 Tax=Haliangium sp. UPWRP_2 TaxID=1931276 RepID=UPI000B540B2C|nr:hypothetical protein [Haliangium sp. UPWRP_2]PSM31556.1 hypothetical protein BVG81_004785 [Haliangium sp. UPWRP_2]
MVPTTLWNLATASTFEQDFTRLPNTLWLAGGVVCPDGDEVLLIEPDAQVRWRCPIPDGPLGHPALLDAERLAYPGLNNALYALDAGGRLLACTKLLSSISTPLLVSDDAVFFGLGVAQGYLARCDKTTLQLAFCTPLPGRLLHAMALVGGSEIWASTTEGLFRVQAASGRVLGGVPGYFVSNPCVDPGGIWVVQTGRDGSELCRLDEQGRMLERCPIRSDDGHSLGLQRAQLDVRWLSGTTVSSVDPIGPDDHSVVVNRTEGQTTLLPPQRSLSHCATENGLFLGGYTYDEDGERGCLVRVDANGRTQSLDLPGLPGAAPPLLDRRGCLFVLTSDGLSCLDAIAWDGGSADR